MKTYVSIVIPNYNKGELVRHSLESLLRQTFCEWEAVVIDDYSSDISWAIIQEYATQDSRIKAIRNDKNQGGNYCRNLGATMTKGKYLLFLDSDDWLAEDCLEFRVDEFEIEENKNVDLLVFEMATCKEGVIGRKWSYGDRKNPLVSFLRHDIPWSIMMPIWRKEAFARTGGFDEAFPRLQDVELHTRALLQGLKFKFAKRNTPDCFYYVDESRMTTDHEKSVEIFVNAVVRYIGEMTRLIMGSTLTATEKNHLLSALVETLMAGIRNVCDLSQLRKINYSTRDSLLARILAINQYLMVDLYASLYKLGINRVKGFNFVYRLIWRMLHG